MKDTLIERTIYREINSGVDEAKNQINDMEYKEAKKQRKKANQNKRRNKNPKKMRIV